jgi:hypothetical protein
MYSESKSTDKLVVLHDIIEMLCANLPHEKIEKLKSVSINWTTMDDGDTIVPNFNISFD